jgi:hypothetical protein
MGMMRKVAMVDMLLVVADLAATRWHTAGVKYAAC